MLVRYQSWNRKNGSLKLIRQVQSRKFEVSDSMASYSLTLGRETDAKLKSLVSRGNIYGIYRYMGLSSF